MLLDDLGEESGEPRQLLRQLLRDAQDHGPALATSLTDLEEVLDEKQVGFGVDENL